MFAAQCVDPVAVLYLTSRGWVEGEDSTLYAACAAGARLTPVLLSPGLGYLAHRFGSAQAVMVSCAATLAALMLMTVVESRVAFAVGYALALGILHAERGTVHQAAVVAASPARGRVRKMAWAPLATSLGALLGPAAVMLCAYGPAAPDG
jgi:MFS family permease